MSTNANKTTSSGAVVKTRTKRQANGSFALGAGGLAKNPGLNIEQLRKELDYFLAADDKAAPASRRIQKMAEELAKEIDKIRNQEEANVATTLFESPLVDMDDLSQLKLRSDARRRLMSRFNMLTSKEFADVLVPKLEDSNINRALNKLVEQDLILAVPFYAERKFPAFQLNDNCTIYPQIQRTLKRAKQYGFSALDVAFWLTTQQDIVLEPSVANGKSGVHEKNGVLESSRPYLMKHPDQPLTFNVIEDALKSVTLPDFLQATPIHLLSDKRFDLYDCLENEWLSE